MKKFLSVCLATLGCAGLASANIVVSLANPPVSLGGGVFEWTYSASVDSSQRLDPTATATTPSNICGGAVCNPSATFFTIYDFAGFFSVISIPSGWSDSEQLTGITPSSINAVDNPGVINITLTYTGPVLDGPASIGDFEFASTLGTEGPGVYAAQATDNVSTSPVYNQTQQNYANLTVPVSTVPEPASLFLIGSGLVALAFVRRRLSR